MSNSFSKIGTLVLASASPARLQVLRDLGIDVKACPTSTDEHHTETEPGLTVQTLARRKMDSFLRCHPLFEGNALSCDTLIWFDGKLIGKPADEADARAQLSLFSGNTHEVFSGYCLLENGKMHSGFDKASVVFNKLSPKQIDDYIISGEYKGAAGSYRIQGLASKFIERIDGDINTVIGVPVDLLGKVFSQSTSEQR